MRSETMLFVSDVEASSQWYQALLGCRSNHGGSEFDRLVDDRGTVLLLMCQGGQRADHPDILVYFVVDDIDAVYQRALSLGLSPSGPPSYNTLSHQTEFSLRDPDGFRVTICRP